MNASVGGELFAAFALARPVFRDFAREINGATTTEKLMPIGKSEITNARMRSGCSEMRSGW